MEQLRDKRKTLISTLTQMFACSLNKATCDKSGSYFPIMYYCYNMSHVYQANLRALYKGSIALSGILVIDRKRAQDQLC